MAKNETWQKPLYKNPGLPKDHPFSHPVDFFKKQNPTVRFVLVIGGLLLVAAIVAVIAVGTEQPKAIVVGNVLPVNNVSEGLSVDDTGVYLRDTQTGKTFVAAVSYDISVHVGDEVSYGEGAVAHDEWVTGIVKVAGTP